MGAIAKGRTLRYSFGATDVSTFTGLLLVLESANPVRTRANVQEVTNEHGNVDAIRMDDLQETITITAKLLTGTLTDFMSEAGGAGVTITFSTVVYQVMSESINIQPSVPNTITLTAKKWEYVSLS
jgi:hypothetical protein